MPPKIRAHVQIFRTGPRQFVLRDPLRGEGFELGVEERFLVELFDGTHTPQQISEAYARRFGERIPLSYVEEFAEQLRREDLLEGKPLSVSEPASAAPEVPAPPLSALDERAGLNHRLDLLTLFFGWVLDPLILVPLAGLVLLASGVLIHQYGELYRQLTLLPRRFSLATIAVIWLLQITLLISLPLALATGIACRKFGGRVQQFKLSWLHRTMPYFECDTGDSFVQMDETERWTLLTLGIWMHLLIGSLVLIGWAMAPRGSMLQTLLLLMVVPSGVRLLLRLNVLLPLDIYAALSYWLEMPKLFDRAKDHAWAWLAGATSPEALPPEQRFGFRLYGVAIYVWKIMAHVAVIGGGGWFLTRRLGGAGAVVGLVLLCWWFSESIEEWVMSNRVLRWLVRGGGHWYIRWPIRLAALAALVACLFIPYAHEVGGDFRLLPASVVGVRAPIAGQIDKVHVADGEWVTAESPIAELAARDQRAAVETARAELEAAVAQLDLLKAGTRSEEIEAARQQVALAQLRVDYHTTDLQRVELLARSDTVSEAELENTRFEKESAEKMLAASSENLAKLTAGFRPEEIRAAEADVKRLKALLKHHEDELALAEIRSPISGRIATAGIETRLGQYVQPGDLVAVIQDGSKLRAEIAATEDAIPWLVIGQRVNLRFWGLNGALVKGRVVDIALTTVKATAAERELYRSDREQQTEQIGETDHSRVVRVFAELENPPKRLLPEMTGYARIKVRPETLGSALARPLMRFFMVEVWSWLP